MPFGPANEGARADCTPEQVAPSLGPVDTSYLHASCVCSLCCGPHGSQRSGIPQLPVFQPSSWLRNLVCAARGGGAVSRGPIWPVKGCPIPLGQTRLRSMLGWMLDFPWYPKSAIWGKIYRRAPDNGGRPRRPRVGAPLGVPVGAADSDKAAAVRRGRPGPRRGMPSAAVLAAAAAAEESCEWGSAAGERRGRPGPRRAMPSAGAVAAGDEPERGGVVAARRGRPGPRRGTPSAAVPTAAAEEEDCA